MNQMMSQLDKEVFARLIMKLVFILQPYWSKAKCYFETKNVKFYLPYQIMTCMC